MPNMRKDYNGYGENGQTDTGFGLASTLEWTPLPRVQMLRVHIFIFLSEVGLKEFFFSFCDAGTYAAYPSALPGSVCEDQGAPRCIEPLLHRPENVKHLDRTSTTQLRVRVVGQAQADPRKCIVQLSPPLPFFFQLLESPVVLNCKKKKKKGLDPDWPWGRPFASLRGE